MTSTALIFDRFDNASVASSLQINGTESAKPLDTEFTWLRDKPLTIRLRWDEDGRQHMSVNSSNRQVDTLGASIDDNAVSFYIGCDGAGATNFEGFIRDLEILQIGGPPII